jgi:hypothetical protein
METERLTSRGQKISRMVGLVFRKDELQVCLGRSLTGRKARQELQLAFSTCRCTLRGGTLPSSKKSVDKIDSNG